MDVCCISYTFAVYLLHKLVEQSAAGGEEAGTIESAMPRCSFGVCSKVLKLLIKLSQVL